LPSPTPSPATTRVFVGEVTGTDAQVAVIATASHARLYFCGGDMSFATMTHWIPSAMLGGSQITPAPADSGGWSVAGQVDESGANGTVVMGAAGTFSFQANPVAQATIAGLYEAQGPCGHLGVIVSQASPGAAATTQGACLPAVGMGMASVEQVNPIHPVERTTDGSIRSWSTACRRSCRPPPPRPTEPSAFAPPAPAQASSGGGHAPPSRGDGEGPFFSTHRRS